MNLFQDFRILSCNFILLQESDRQLVKFQHKRESEKRLLPPEIGQVPRRFLFWLYLCSMSGLVHQVEQGMEQPGRRAYKQGWVSQAAVCLVLFYSPRPFGISKLKSKWLFAFGFQQGPSPRVRGSGTCGRRCAGDQEAHLLECQGLPATSQCLKILVNSSAFKFLLRAEVSLSFPFCCNLQLVYLIKHCKSCG